jgi:hypothetical protein
MTAAATGAPLARVHVLDQPQVSETLYWQRLRDRRRRRDRQLVTEMSVLY